MVRFNRIGIVVILQVFTMWYCCSEPKKAVFTGGPCTGKTTLINAIAAKGYKTVEEAATAVIIEEQSKKNMQPWKELTKFQLAIVNKQLNLFKPAFSSNNTIVFCDRAIPDGIAYFDFPEEVPQELIDGAKSIKYDYIFVLDPIEAFETTGIRREGKEEALKLHNRIIDVYKKLGYQIITVPAVSVSERVEFVLNKLKEMGEPIR